MGLCCHRFARAHLVRSPNATGWAAGSQGHAVLAAGRQEASQKLRRVLQATLEEPLSSGPHDCLSTLRGLTLMILINSWEFLGIPK